MCSQTKGGLQISWKEREQPVIPSFLRYCSLEDLLKFRDACFLNDFKLFVVNIDYAQNL